MFSSLVKLSVLLAVMLSGLAACSDSTTTVMGSTPTSTSTATLIPTSTVTPVLGVCNSADFPVGSAPIGTKQDGPPSSDFQYPPLTYSLYRGPAAGNYDFLVCSPGDPAAILAFMQRSIPQENWSVLTSTEQEKWTINSVTATEITAEEPSILDRSYCFNLRMTVGQRPAYPGEWEINFVAPGNMCVHH